MRQCAGCGYIEGTDPAKSWRWHTLVCGDGGDMCEDCYYGDNRDGHYYTCDVCRRYHEQDQAMLAADQLSKDSPGLLWTADDRAASILGDPSKRAYHVVEEVGL